MKEPLSFGPVNTGSLLSSSEGLGYSGLLALCTTTITSGDPELSKWAFLALGIATGCYAISRGIAKKNA
jgi:hypothetical protein